MGMCGTRPFLVSHTRPAFPKIPTVPSAFPLLGAPQAPGDEPLPEGGKSLGGRPPEAEGNLQLPRHTRPDLHRSQPGRPKCYPTTGEVQCYYSRRSCCDWDCGSCSTPHRTWKCGTRPFFGGSGRRAVAHMRPAFPKNAYGDEPNHPEGGNGLGGKAPLRPLEKSSYRDTPGQIRAAASTSGRSCCDSDCDCAEESSVGICHMRTSPSIGDTPTAI